MSSLNNLDVIILVITAISALIGLSRGFVKEVLSIVGWILAFICIISLLPILNPFTMKYITDGVFGGVITALFIFILFLICWTMFTSSIVKQIRTSFFSGVDKFLGFLFGVARAFLLVILLNILITWVIPVEEQSAFFAESKYFNIAGDFAKPIEKLIPAETLEDIKSKAQGMSKEEETAQERQKNETDELFDKLARPQLKKKAALAKSSAAPKKPTSVEKKNIIKENLEPAGYNKKERNQLDDLIDDI